MITRLLCFLALVHCCVMVPCAGADYDQLLELIDQGDTVTLETLLRPGDLDMCDEIQATLFMRACWSAPVPTLRYLLSKKPNLEAVDQEGQTAIFWALLDTSRVPKEPTPSQIMSGKLGIRKSPDKVPLLMAAGANIHHIDQHGENLLLSAIAVRNEPIALFLIENGANIHYVKPHGNGSLWFTARYNTPEVAKVLISHSVPIDVANDRGQTPLMIAAKNGSEQVAQLLLNAGADPTLRDQEGKTALQYAREELSAWPLWSKERRQGKRVVRLLERAVAEAEAQSR